MIEFTQEELLMILLDIEALNPQPTQKVQATINKIKLKIDNYCEHDQLKIDMGEYAEIHPCKKCGEFYL